MLSQKYSFMRGKACVLVLKMRWKLWLLVLPKVVLDKSQNGKESRRNIVMMLFLSTRVNLKFSSLYEICSDSTCLGPSLILGAKAYFYHKSYRTLFLEAISVVWG